MNEHAASLRSRTLATDSIDATALVVVLGTVLISTDFGDHSAAGTEQVRFIPVDGSEGSLTDRGAISLHSRGAAKPTTVHIAGDGSVAQVYASALLAADLAALTEKELVG